MVRSAMFRIAAWIVVTTISAAALPRATWADATNPPAQTHYATTITAVYGSQYPIAGHLDLELAPGGTLRGYYHNAFQKAFIPVTGGRDGDYIWFDIGPTPIDLGLGIGTGERLHVVGSLNGDGSFRGQAFPQMPLDNGSFPSGSLAVSDQYLFAATPTERGPEDYQATPSSTPPG